MSVQSTPAALRQLTVERLQRGQPAEALAVAREAVAADPDNADGHANLATALNMLGCHDAAVASYEDALALDPDLAEAQFGLATALQALRRDDEAIACFERALAIDPDYAEAHCGLGASLQNVRRHADALPHYRAALEIDPDYAEAHAGLGRTLQSLRRDAEAVVHLGVGLADDPGNAELRCMIAAVLRRLDRHAEALEHLEQASRLQPDHPGVRLDLGVTLEEMGQIDAARAAFEAAIDLDPGKPAGYHALFQSRRAVAGEKRLLALQTLATDTWTMPVAQQIRLHFALGKALGDTGEPRLGFEHLLEGNRLQRGEYRYDEAPMLGLAGRLRATFSRVVRESAAALDGAYPTPIFILGMPRSGSTLIEQVIASHPLVHAGGERGDFRAAMVSAGLDTPSRPYPEAVAAMDAGMLRQLGSDYLGRLARAAPGAAYVTDKAPANFWVAGLIHLALPHARIICSRRDPVDTCLSCFSTLFDSDQPFAFDLGELGRYHAACDAVMAHWHDVLPAGAILDVHYEDLVAALEPQARRILTYCGLAWDPACLSFHTTDRPVRTASVAQVRQPIYRSSVGRWRPDEAVLRPLLDGLATRF